MVSVDVGLMVFLGSFLGAMVLAGIFAVLTYPRDKPAPSLYAGRIIDLLSSLAAKGLLYLSNNNDGSYIFSDDVLKPVLRVWKRRVTLDGVDIGKNLDRSDLKLIWAKAQEKLTESGQVERNAKMAAVQALLEVLKGKKD